MPPCAPFMASRAALGCASGHTDAVTGRRGCSAAAGPFWATGRGAAHHACD
eukprot:CAMPEP_0204365406 /NCGR_PEP_ID=MMETSP0469-20131031/41889_1 /ASSEMBLY_ACC=CAM_ASM_000384 /TAXON_ID=2969 /ORGANISM="Oxyrrhis marina" /LENGTH=50 /DNA_ID=CAMNT_0051354463 /DNA_START=23 /DNA_END=175 /DNA_ORIENTATION=+